MSHLVFGDVDSILQLEDVEVLVRGQASLVPVVKLTATRFDFLDESLVGILEIFR